VIIAKKVNMIKVQVDTVVGDIANIKNTIGQGQGVGLDLDQDLDPDLDLQSEGVDILQVTVTLKQVSIIVVMKNVENVVQEV
jgi:hypothetical protein